MRSISPKGREVRNGSHADNLAREAVPQTCVSDACDAVPQRTFRQDKLKHGLNLLLLQLQAVMCRNITDPCAPGSGGRGPHQPVESRTA